MENNVTFVKMASNFIPIVSHVVVMTKDPMEIFVAMMDNANAKPMLKD